MKKTLQAIIVGLLLLSVTPAWATWVNGQTSLWPAVELTGGGDALDGIAGASISQNDKALTHSVTRGAVYLHYVATGSEAESDPTYIRPNDVGGGVTTWKLLRVVEYGDHAASQVTAFVTAMLSRSAFSGITDFALDSNVTAFVTAMLAPKAVTGTSMSGSPTFDTTTMSIGIGGISKYMVSAGTTVTADMLGGGIVYWVGTDMNGVTIPYVSSNTPFLVVKDMSGSGLTVWAENKDSAHQRFHKGGSWGNKIWVAPGNVGHQLAITDVLTGTSKFHDVIGSIGANWTLSQ